MTELPAEVAGEAYVSDALWTVLEDVVNVGNRMAGQEGERVGAELVAEALGEAGLREVRTEEFDIPGWWRGDASITLSAYDYSRNAQHEVIGLPGSPAASVSGRLVDVGYGTEDDFEEAELEGNVAMASSASPDGARSRHRMEKYADASEAGAVGFVFRNHVEGCLPPTGEVGYHRRPGPIPAVGVSKEVGSALARTCRDGQGVASNPDDIAEGPTIDLAVDCQNGPATSQNVQAIVGPETDQEVLVTAHVDAHDIAVGANDNGSGTSIAVEVGRLLATIEDELDSRVRIVVFGAEEIGLYGAYNHVETTDIDSIRAVVNVDVAGRSRNLHVHSNGFDKLASVFTSVANEFDAPLTVDETVSPHGDQWAFVERGVPGVMVSSVSDEKSGRGWSHTHADTLDKLDPRDLRDNAIQITAAVLRLAAGDREITPAEPSEIRDELTPGYERELRESGRWHFEDGATDTSERT